jgi:MOSC domain-containing protein YiiM
MEVRSVSFSTLTIRTIDGVPIKTSIVYTPTEQIEVSSEMGVMGNRTVVHNAPIYIFFAKHYDHWARTLGVQRSAWGECHWGENITFRFPPNSKVMDDRDFHLGDIWSLGNSGVLLQVCGARVPCSRLSWRLNLPAKILPQLAASGFWSVYARPEIWRHQAR